MSKETVNRTLAASGLSAMAALLLSLAFSGPAGAQVALVVGSVRDQHGAPIEGARVTSTASSGPVQAMTDPSGTFALQGDGIASVVVACRYCATTALPVRSGEPVVAIVRRYDALIDVAPSAADLQALPYAHVESSVSLRPFTLLRQNTDLVAGSQLSDRGLSPSNALLIDANVPDYDVAFGVSPYYTIPAAYEQAASVAPAANAFLYGDQAASGIVTLSPFGGNNASAVLGGSDATLRLQAGSDAARVAAGTYSNDAESRQRADAQVTIPLSTAQTIAVNGATSQGREFASAVGTIANGYTFVNGAWDDAQPTIDAHASFSADRGGYAAHYSYGPLTDTWSDSDFTAGVRSRGSLQAFADVSSRFSTGIYDAQALGGPRIGATLTQDRIDAGLDFTQPDYRVTGGVGFFGIGYTGGSGGTSHPDEAHLAIPSLQIALFPQSKWSAALDASGSFTLPTLWQNYGYADNYEAFTYDRNSLYSAQVSYTDDSRVRVTFEGDSQRVNGYSNGFVTSMGGAVTWQFAPELSLRVWSMHVSDSTASSGQTPYFEPVQPTTGAAWLTYESPTSVRVDAIYRRDVLDGAPYYHFDGDVSGPIAHGLRWYAGVEDRLRATRVDAGLRFAP